MRNTQRLDKILSNLGFGTRKEIKQIIKDGRINVDGNTANDGATHVDPESSKIEIDGDIINYRKFIYLMMNKPAGVISATTDARLKTVLNILPEEYYCFDLFPAGRLDIDTEGLLLLTNDGQLAHEILSPKKHVPKKYYALIEGEVGEKEKESFKNGVILDDGYETLPAVLEVIKQGVRSEIFLTIHEGKFHQVKRMFEAVGKKVLYLKRVEMGSLQLDENLKLGECRELTTEEVEMLKAPTKKKS